MFKIYKITSNPTVDFAAEELKKYLRMMMPRFGEIVIERDAAAITDFRLGVMSDLGLDTSEAEDVTLDDIVHIDVDADGNGIIAGSKVRMVLEAAGIHNIRAKCLRSNNPINVVKATLAGLSELRTAEQVANTRGITADDVKGGTQK